MSLEEFGGRHQRSDGVCGGLFERATIERLLLHFKMSAWAAVADPEQHMNRFSLLSEAERKQLLEVWNQDGRLLLQSPRSRNSSADRRAVPRRLA